MCTLTDAQCKALFAPSTPWAGTCTGSPGELELAQLPGSKDRSGAQCHTPAEKFAFIDWAPSMQIGGACVCGAI